MSLHLLTAIATRYASKDNQELVQMQRVGYIQGYHTLSDLIVQDDWSTNYTLNGYDKLYYKHVRWDMLYIPCKQEHLVIYSLCKTWFCRGPVPILHTDNNLTDIEAMIVTNYTKACVGACGALRSLLGITTVEIEKLCEDILLYIGDILKTEIQDLPIDVIEKRMALRRLAAKKKLRKID